MAKCKPITREIPIICIGDLNRKIIIKTRVLTPPSTNSTDYTEVFTTVATVWAMIKTSGLKGRSEFDGTQMSAMDRISNTHEMYIRYRSGITQEHFIEYNSEYYDILEVFNMDEANTVTHLKCKLRGPTANSINLA
jgi:SPP1 family predicted phage head-tail adaptor